MNLKIQNYNNLPMEQMIHDIESEDKRLLELNQSEWPVLLQCYYSRWLLLTLI